MISPLTILVFRWTSITHKKCYPCFFGLACGMLILRGITLTLSSPRLPRIPHTSIVDPGGPQHVVHDSAALYSADRQRKKTDSTRIIVPIASSNISGRDGATSPVHEQTMNEFRDMGTLSSTEKEIDKLQTHPVIPEKLMRIRPMILKDYPSAFLDDYKNPCYKKKTDGMLRCLPYFFLLGTPKSGTSDIWSKIASHPDIVYSTKEPHWWTRYSFPSEPLDSYELNLMATNIERETSMANDTRRASIITGDGSASTFWDNHQWETFFPEDFKTGPPYIMADVIHTVLPDAKLIVTLRDPTERLYSDYMFFPKPERKSALEFHKRVVRGTMEFAACLDNRSLSACAYSRSFDEPMRLHVGLYSLYARDWLQRYRRDQFLALKLEEWQENCSSILPGIFKFLNVAELPPLEIARICNSHRENVNTRKRLYGPMLKKTRKILRDFYRPYVEDLADFLQEEKFLWDYRPTDA